MGNPPYVCGRNMEDDTRLKTKWYEVCDSGSTDLYIPFFQIAVEMLNDEGKIGYITMNSFLKSLNARKLRAFLLIISLIFILLIFGGIKCLRVKVLIPVCFSWKRKRAKLSIIVAMSR